VISSTVGPSPPLMNRMGVRLSASCATDFMSSISSPIEVSRLRSMPIEKRAAPRSRPCVLSVRPDKSSLPIEMSSAVGFIIYLSVCILYFLRMD